MAKTNYYQVLGINEQATAEHLENGALGRALRDEEEAQRSADAAFWRPLRQRLEELRREARRR